MPRKDQAPRLADQRPHQLVGVRPAELLEQPDRAGVVAQRAVTPPALGLELTSVVERGRHVVASGTRALVDRTRLVIGLGGVIEALEVVERDRAPDNRRGEL